MLATSEFLPKNEDTQGGALTHRNRMEIVLRYFTDSGFQVGMAEDFGINRSTVCKTVSKVIDLILAKAHLWLHFPTTIPEINHARL